jgi:hypothetical protein
MIYPTNMKNINFKYFVFRLHKNNKRVDLIECVYFQISNFLVFYLCVGHNTKNFTLKIRVFVGYIIDFFFKFSRK